MKYHTIIFGCQMNYADAERVDAVMKTLGYLKTGKIDNADVAIVVACSVRQHAIDRIFGLRKKVEAIKKVRPCIAILTGCVLEDDKKKMKDFFDFVFPITELGNLPKLLGKAKPFDIQEYFSIEPKYNSRFQAYVPISNGCNQFCSYCVVPYTRGRETYRDPDEIIEECRCLIEKGYKEITLLGQTVNSYSYKGVNFSELLCRIDNIPGNFWIRFLSSHPNFFTPELIRIWKKSKHITPYLHLAVQSGDNTILKKMNRRYTIGKFLRIVREIQKAIPDITISTDIIVGYSGEAKKQFENTVKLMKILKFDMAYISKYSQRKGTLGEKLHKDDVSLEEKKKRHEILNKILAKSALEKNKKYIGRVIRVLVEGHHKRFWIGKSDTFKTVKIYPKENEGNLAGEFVYVEVVDATHWGLLGKRIARE